MIYSALNQFATIFGVLGFRDCYLSPDFVSLYLCDFGQVTESVVGTSWFANSAFIHPAQVFFGNPPFSP